MGLGIVLVGVVSNDPEVRIMHKAHEEGGNDTSKKRRSAVYPHVFLINLTFNSQGVQIPDLIGRLSDPEGWVETTSSNRACKCNHGIESHRNCTCLNDSISTVLSSCEDLTQDAQCEEKCAPKLQKEDLHPMFIIHQASNAALERA
jgi:hypothetical protein